MAERREPVAPIENQRIDNECLVQAVDPQLHITEKTVKTEALDGRKAQFLNDFEDRSAHSITDVLQVTYQQALNVVSRREHKTSC